MDYIPILKKKGQYGQISEPVKNSLKPYISGLTAVTGNIKPQVIYGMIDFFNLCGNVAGKFLLIFNDFSNKILQFIDQIDR